MLHRVCFSVRYASNAACWLLFRPPGGQVHFVQINIEPATKVNADSQLGLRLSFISRRFSAPLCSTARYRRLQHKT